jgi:NADH-quinone oxidoreductase subunit N
VVGIRLNEFVSLLTFDFINFFNTKIGFMQIFIFYFFLLSILYLLKNYFVLIKFSLVEFPLIFIIIINFLYIFFYIDDLLLLYFYLEGLGLLTYLFLGLNYLKDNHYEGVLKYFILNSFASILLLFGISLIYLATLNTSFNQVMLYLICFGGDEIFSYVIVFGFVSVFISFLFKLAVFPCFIWIIDVYESLPFVLILVLLSIYKFVFFYIFLKLLIQVFFPLIQFWRFLLFVSIIGSLVVGGLGALVQQKLKRFIGYTSVNQIGYVLLGLSCGTNEGILAAYTFIIFYVITNILFFLIILIYYHTLKNFSNQTELTELKYLTDLNKLQLYLNPSIFVLLVIIIASMLGLPPFANFFIKYDLLVHLVYQSHYCVVGVVLIISIISAFYYIRLLKMLFFEYKILNLLTKHSSFISYFTKLFTFNINNLILYFIIYIQVKLNDWFQSITDRFFFFIIAILF